MSYNCWAGCSLANQTQWGFCKMHTHLCQILWSLLKQSSYTKLHLDPGPINNVLFVATDTGPDHAQTQCQNTDQMRISLLGGLAVVLIVVVVFVLVLVVVIILVLVLVVVVVLGIVVHKALDQVQVREMPTFEATLAPAHQHTGPPASQRTSIVFL